MEAIHVQLPPTLVQQIHQEVSSDESLSQIVAEAIQVWLEKRREEKAKTWKILQTLRETGAVMASDRQRALAEAMMAPLSLKEAPSRAQVRASLANLEVPLSEEIIVMRGER